jgi:hypothetical protein
MTVTLDDASATLLAASDGGLLTVERGLALGCSRATLYRRLKACGWQQVDVKVWAASGLALDIGIRLRTGPACGAIEVTDARGDRRPRIPAHDAERDEIQAGCRGLLLVAALADRWDTAPYPPGGKTVRADLSTPPIGS